MEKNTAVDALKDAGYALTDAQYKAKKAAVAAVMAGASWQEVGAALGISKQTAHARYSEDVASAKRMAKFEAEKPEEAAAAKAAGRAKAAETMARIREEVAAEMAAEKAATPAPETPETASIFLDPIAPANAGTAPEYTNPYNWGPDDWGQDRPDHFKTPIKGRPKKCPHCEKKNHIMRRGGTTWIYPGCSPTTTDPSYV